MISLRKTLVTLLAPLGAATIIGTGFATWSFGLEETVIADPITNDVNITAEVTNGKVSILECPSVLVFSEGTQGPLDLFDGISFYSDKVIKQGTEFNVSLLDTSSAHAVSLIYDNTISPAKLYYSWTEDKNTQNLSSTISGELESSDAQDGSYFGTWTGEFGEQNPIDITITLDQNGSDGGASKGSIYFTRGTETINDRFSFVESGTIEPDITITDSTLSFRYDYDDKFLVDEDQTGYKLNTRMKLTLDSSDPFSINCVKNETNLIYQTPSSEPAGTLTTFNLKKSTTSSSSYELALAFDLGESDIPQRINYKEMTLIENRGGDSDFPDGVYGGFSTTGISCELIVTRNDNQTFTISVQLGAMDHYLKIVDSYQNMVDDEGYFNISENKTYAQTALNFDIDESHLNDKNPYIVYTCQLARLVGYASSEVKPTDSTKFFGLQVAAHLGGWQLKIEVCEDFTSTRG